jgi:hypothetical protein
MSNCERFIDSKQRHFESYFVSPITIEVIHIISNYLTLNQKIVVPVSGQVFQVRREISKVLSQKPNILEIFHQNQILMIIYTSHRQN